MTNLRKTITPADPSSPRTSAIAQLRCRCRRGLTLMESLIAAALLGMIVVAVATAIGTAQHVSFEGHKRMLAAVASDDLMSELTTLSYEDIRAEHGRSEAVGALETLDGVAYPDSFWAIGRSVAADIVAVEEPDSGIIVRGLRVTVTVFDDGASLASIETFIPEPVQ